MTDRELLGLAAKAAGFVTWDFLAYVQDRMLNVYDKEGRQQVWNPISDGGDALQLAVKLGMLIHVDNEYSRSHVKCKGRWFTCPHNDDADLATRRAIVCAAAEIGESMP